ncbi:MAG TPA: SDR family oxidoreductase [Kiritimatiellia bacterium]|nr:SDR family oxidoreductase [Kiritimatiellia bacterium]HQQ92751.1 SDR family oxidoreductase [Kiritimatiellia bacterium]
MRTALVTGSAKGIGRAIALALARDGFRVAVHYRSSQEEAQATVAAIRAAGGTAEAFAADLAWDNRNGGADGPVRDPAAAQAGGAEAPGRDPAAALVAAVEAWAGPAGIHTLVCNAGIIKSQLIAFTRLEEWRDVMTANLDSAFLLTKAVARLMARRKAGRIIYISSDAGLLGDLMRAAYSASKAGLLGLAKTAARELAASNVTVNAVAPGIITTDMTADIPETRRAKQLDAIPLARFGTPEEVAGCVSFLASDAAGWITGQTLCVDGGLCMRA